MSTLVLAVVDIDGPKLLVVAATFFLTFVGVCVVAYVLLANTRRGGGQTTSDGQMGARLALSRLALSRDHVARAAEAAVAAMSVSPVGRVSRADRDRLESGRATLVSVYRAFLITLGLLGIVAGGLLLRSHTPANMIGLPGAMVLLLALGTLVNGLLYGRRGRR